MATFFLSLIVFGPALAALVLALWPGTTDEEHQSRRDDLFRIVTLIVTICVFALTMLVFFVLPETQFNDTSAAMQSTFNADWIPSFNIEYFMGVDGISLPLIVLTALISMLAMAASWSIKKHVKGYCILFLLLETGMLGVFMALDFFLFYVFWEVMLLPMYFLIGIWGGPRREYAALKFFLYTLVGSVLMLIAILMLYFKSDLVVLYQEIDNDLQAPGGRNGRARYNAASISARGGQSGLEEDENLIACAQTDTCSGQRREGKWNSPGRSYIQPAGTGRHRSEDRTLQSQLAALGLPAAADRVHHQGPLGAIPYLAAGRACRGSHTDLDDPGGSAAENGRLRDHPHLLSDLSARRL